MYFAACPAAFTHLLRSAGERAEVGFLCAGALRNPAQRERVLRQAWSAAMLNRDKSAAARYAARVQDQPWYGEVNFFDAVQAAAQMDGAAGEKLLWAAAERNPSLAIREVAEYYTLAGGAKAFERAALLTPAETVMLARGTSATAAALRAAMAGSRHARLAALRRLAAREDIGDVVRQRLAILPDVAEGVLERDAGYVSRLVDRRLAASGDEAMLYDRALASFSQMLFVEARSGLGALERIEPRSLSARAAFLLLSYGRTESDDSTFERLFDGLLAPKLRGGALAGLLEETKGLHLRAFLTSAIAHRRFEAVLGLAGQGAPALVERAVSGIERAARPTEEAVAAAEILDSLSGEERLRHAARTIVREHPKQPALYGLLAARLAQRGYRSEALKAVAARYEPYLKGPGQLEAAALFDGSGLCVQRHFFYDDQDGVESFANFRQTFERDPAWKWEDRDGWVLVTGSGAGGRRIVMAASVPVDLLAPGNAGLAEKAAARQSAVTRYLAGAGLAPAVVVHRGHSYHVEKTIRNLTDSARLIFLGSCRGTEEVDAVMAAAPAAQLIATRSVGTQAVNDPLLKAINGELLRGAARLDWEALWARQGAQLGMAAAFRDYVAPHRNSAAIFLAAYHRYLAGE